MSKKPFSSAYPEHVKELSDKCVKEKAKELVFLFLHIPDEAMPPDSNNAWTDKIMAKMFAIRCVDEVLDNLNCIEQTEFGNLYGRFNQSFWEEVRIDINSV